MILIRRATPADSAEIERLIAAYHVSERVVPKPEKIAWTVQQILQNRSPGILLVAHERNVILGVALGLFQPSAELGLTLVVHDFFVEPTFRRKGVGRALAKRLLEEAREMNAEHVDLEVFPANSDARAFWESMGFRPSGRIVYSRELQKNRVAKVRTRSIASRPS
jgi:GNAT superfamily N-acetyltransferase